MKKKDTFSVGVAHILATFNNTMVSISTPRGDLIAWSSAGANGFKGSRKSTPYAAQVTASKALEKAMAKGLKSLSVQVKGAGAGRESAIRALAASNINISEILDKTPVPHNGCRPPKKRSM